jgi:hypothetical protein
MWAGIVRLRLRGILISFGGPAEADPAIT